MGNLRGHTLARRTSFPLKSCPASPTPPARTSGPGCVSVRVDDDENAISREDVERAYSGHPVRPHARHGGADPRGARRCKPLPTGACGIVPIYAPARCGAATQCGRDGEAAVVGFMEGTRRGTLSTGTIPPATRGTTETWQYPSSATHVVCRTSSEHQSPHTLFPNFIFPSEGKKIPRALHNPCGPSADHRGSRKSATFPFKCGRCTVPSRKKRTQVLPTPRRHQNRPHESSAAFLGKHPRVQCHGRVSVRRHRQNNSKND